MVYLSDILFYSLCFYNVCLLFFFFKYVSLMFLFNLHWSRCNASNLFRCRTNKGFLIHQQHLFLSLKDSKKKTLSKALKSTCLILLLMQDLCDAALHRSELLIDVMQELHQVCSVQLTALHQHLQGGNSLSEDCQRKTKYHTLNTSMEQDHT